MLTLEMPALNQLFLLIIHLAVSALTLHMDLFFIFFVTQRSKLKYLNRTGQKYMQFCVSYFSINVCTSGCCPSLLQCRTEDAKTEADNLRYFLFCQLDTKTWQRLSLKIDSHLSFHSPANKGTLWSPL